MDAAQTLANIFKAYDIRGKVGSELTEAVAERTGAAFSDWLSSTGDVVVGRDMRPDSQQLAEAFMQGVIRTGRNVIDLGMVTSDMAIFAVKQLGASGAAIVTASHNPGEYNGIKLFDDTPKTIGLDQGLDHIRDAVLKEASAATIDTLGTITTKNLTEAWVEYCLDFINIDNLRPLHIVVDAGNGMAGAILPTLLKKLPFKTEELYFTPDGTFPNHQANPQNLETLKDLQQKIADTHADLGIAFDGDGDRMAMVDEAGRPIAGSEMMSLLAQKYRQTESPSLVYEVRTSRAVVKRLEAAGFTGIRSKAGRSNIGEVMRQYNAIFGGETTGHFFFKDYWFNDSGLLSMLIALEQICLSSQPLSSLIAGQHTTDHMIAETNFEVADADAVIQAVAQHYQELKQDTLDGLSVSGPDWWLNLRKSNTEPLIRLNAEAQDEVQLTAIVETITQLAR